MLVFRLVKTPNFHRLYLQTYNEPGPRNFSIGTSLFFLDMPQNFVGMEHHWNKYIVKMALIPNGKHQIPKIT